jgi:tetratricopeptide (TPR) repeat protein
MELSENLFDQVETLSAKGSNFFDKTAFDQALEKWVQALDLLPEPKTDWDAYTWLSTSIGDAHYQLAQFDVARQFLFDALNGPDAQGSPFIHYRLGQCEVKIGNQDSAKNHLLQAYMLDGEKIFHGEPDGPTYLQMLKDAKLIL